MPEHLDDPYLDPDTSVLRNLTGASTWEQLEQDEGDLVEARAVQLAESPVPVTGDLAHLQAIHAHLFQDVYEWAGQPRTVEISKHNGDQFMISSRIGTGAEYAFGELAQDNMLGGLDRNDFVNRLAHHYDQINYLHPFREGNGRTQRVFWTQIAAQAGHSIDWSSVRGEVNDAASRAAIEQGDLQPLRQMFGRATATALERDAFDRYQQIRAAASPGTTAQRVASGHAAGTAARNAGRSPHPEPRSPERDTGYDR